MRMVSRREMMAAGAGIVPFAGLAALAAAQEGEGSAREGAMGLDPGLAACLLIMGRKQIEVCRFALERLQHNDVKAFAQAEIDEHETIKTQLQGVGFRYPSSPASREEATGADADHSHRGQVLSVGRARLPEGMSQLIAIDHEVGEQCIATAKAELGKLEGQKLDERFIGYQLDAHYALFDHAVVFRKHASPEMAAILDKGRPIIEQHIATCKDLMAKLEAMKGQQQ